MNIEQVHMKLSELLDPNEMEKRKKKERTMAELPRYISDTHVAEVCEHHPKMVTSAIMWFIIPLGLFIMGVSFQIPSLWGVTCFLAGFVVAFYGLASHCLNAEEAKKSGRCEKYSTLDLFDYFIRKKKFKRLLQLKDEVNQYNNLCDMIHTIWEMRTHTSGEKIKQFHKSCKIMHRWREKILLQLAADKAQRATKGDVFKLPDSAGDTGLDSLVKADEESTELNQIMKELEKDTGGSI